MRIALAFAALFTLAACTTSVTRADDPGSSAIGDRVDYSCKTDADCTVKDVGNCCGRYPACVNRASPTFPERVKEECEKKGLAGVCGFPDIRSCQCVAQQCRGVNGPGRGDTEVQ